MIDIKTVGIGQDHICSLRNDGYLNCWKLRYPKESIGIIPNDFRKNVEYLSVGKFVSCAINKY